MNKIAVLTLGIIVSLVNQNQNGCFAKASNVLECSINHCIHFEYLTKAKDRVDIYITCNIYFTKNLFCDEVWSNVTHLRLVGNWRGYDVYLSTNTFEKLTHLEELRFVGLPIVRLFPGVFHGLNNLRVLDLSNCVSLGYSNFMSAFESDKTLPNLQELILHMTGNRDEPFVLRDSFAKLLYPRPVRVLDISMKLITEFDLAPFALYATHLEFLNASGISVINLTASNDNIDFKSLKIVDISLANADKNRYSYFWCMYPIQVVSDSSFSRFINNLETLYVDNICGDTRTRKVLASSPIKWTCYTGTPFYLKNLYMRRNNISVLDIEINWQCSVTIELIDLSDNGLQYINPKAFWNMTSLTRLLLADNSLGDMVSSHMEQFKQLFAPFKRLEILDMSRNNIATLPDGVFIHNGRLIRLYLSGNGFKHISFNLDGLNNLELLDLSDNQLFELDSSGLSKLNLMSGNTKLDFTGRTIQCSRCEHYDTVKWLLEHTKSIFSNTSLRCVDSKTDAVLVSKSVQDNLQNICDRSIYIRRKIIISVIAIVFFGCFVFWIIVLIKRRRKVFRQQQRRQQTLTKLENGQLQFAAFILYSSKDEEFVRTCVLTQLEEHLHLEVDCQRELVALGDKDFKIGQCIMNEVIRCTKASASVVVILSDNFCNSNYCLQEFDVAFRVGKPIILMMKGEVDMSLAPPAIRDLFNTYVRVVWRLDDHGKYELMTSWNNVSNSILELGALLKD